MPPSRWIRVTAIVVALDVLLFLLAVSYPFAVIERAGPTNHVPRWLARLSRDARQGDFRPRLVSLDPFRPVDVYRGLGTWIDVYDTAWKHPAWAVERMRRRGVRTLYLETSNFSRPSWLVFPHAIRRFIDAAHANGIAVVAWYLPGLRNMRRDINRSMAAINLRTPRGNAFDSFALDIEAGAVRKPWVRTKRLMRLSQRIRAAVDPDYALGAIIPSPQRLQTDHRYWPRFPYRRLAGVYNVFLPMTYFTYTVKGLRGARGFTAQNIDIIRRQTGDPTVLIHVIGGIGGRATRGETAGFVQAVRRQGVLGASYYTFPLTSARDWSRLALVRTLPQ